MKQLKCQHILRNWWGQYRGTKTPCINDVEIMFCVKLAVIDTLQLFWNCCQSFYLQAKMYSGFLKNVFKNPLFRLVGAINYLLPNFLLRFAFRKHAPTCFNVAECVVEGGWHKNSFFSWEIEGVTPVLEHGGRILQCSPCVRNTVSEKNDS